MQSDVRQVELATRPYRICAMRGDEPLRSARANQPSRVEQGSTGVVMVVLPTRGGGGGGGADAVPSAKSCRWVRQVGRGKELDVHAGLRLPDGLARAAGASSMCRGRCDALSRKKRRTLAPPCSDFVVELWSGSDVRDDLRAKRALRISQGVELARLRDPGRKAVKVHRPDRKAEVRGILSAVEGDGLAGEFVLELGRVRS